MKRHMFKVLALMLAVMLLAGCGKTPAPTTTAAPETTAPASTAQETETPGRQVPDTETTEPETTEPAATEPESTAPATTEAEPVVEAALPALFTQTVYDYSFDGNRDVFLAESYYGLVSLSEQSAKDYPMLAAAMKAEKDEEAKRKEEFLQNFNSGAKSQYEEDKESFRKNYLHGDVLVRRADRRIVSFLYDEDVYYGMKHRERYMTGVNFETQTGKRLDLRDVVTDVDKLGQLIYDELKIFYGDGVYEDLKASDIDWSRLKETAWTLDPYGITFYFGYRELTEYSAGNPTVTLSFAEPPDLVKKEYQEAEEQYCVEFSVDRPMYFDLDGTGTPDIIGVEGQENMDGAFETLSVLVNGHWYDKDGFYAYNLNPVFVHTGKGRNYVYVHTASDNDYQTFENFKVESGTTGYLGTTSCGWHYEMPSDASLGYLRSVLTDPRAFVLDTRTDLLSTINGTCPYYVDSNGRPKTDQTWYDLSYTLTFTAKADVPVTLVTKEGKKVGEGVVPKGTKLGYVRTDDKSWGDFIISEGGPISDVAYDYVRVDVEIRDWTKYVNNVDIEELFDGIMFAG